MSRRLFRLEIPQAVQDENLDGAELTRRGFAVFKFAPQSTAHNILADDAAEFARDVNAQPGATATLNAGNRTLELTNAGVSLPTGRTYSLIGWKITIGNETTTGNLNIAAGAGSNATHYNFINCNIEVRNLEDYTDTLTYGIGYGNRGATATRADDQFGDVLTSRSLNSYGCLWMFARGFNAIRPVRWADIIDSEVMWFDGAANFLSTSGNGRHIRTTFNKIEGATARIFAAGRTIVEGSIYNNFSFRHGNTGANQPAELVLDRPAFLPLYEPGSIRTDLPPLQATIVDLNIGSTINQPVQLIGGPSLGNDVGQVWGQISGAGFLGGMISTDGVERAYSGLNQFYGVGDRYFSDATLTTGASGVRIRMNGTINPDTVTSTEGTAGERRFSELGAAFTTGNTGLCGQTNADGRLATHIWYDEGDRLEGYVDWWQWNDQAGQGLTVWNTNQDGTTSPEGMMIYPISRAYITNNTTPGAQTLADRQLEIVAIQETRRSFAWDVNVPYAAVAYPDTREELVISTQNRIPASLVGTRVKAAYVDANLLPNADLDAEFPMHDPANPVAASLNDIDNAMRALWFDYLTDRDPDEDMTTTANNYNLTINPNHPTHYSATTDAGVTTLTVRSAGIGPRDGDLFNTRRFHVVDLGNTDSSHINTVRNQNIIATTINNPRIGNSITAPCFDNCTVTGTLNIEGNPDGFSQNNFFFNLTDVSGVDLVQLPYTPPGSDTPEATGVTIIRGRVNDGGTIRALAATDFASVTEATAHGGTIRFENPPAQLTLRPDATLQDLRDRGGFWRVTDTSGNLITQASGNVDITSTTTIEDVTVNFDSGSTTLRAYYQPGATPGGYVANYGFLEVNSGMQTADRDFVVPAVDYSALAADTVVDRTDDITVTTLSSGTSQTMNVLVDVSNNVTPVQSQEIAIVILNSVDYINTVIARNLTGHQRILEFLQPFLVRYNGGLMDDPLSTPANPLPQIPVRPIINLFVAGTQQRGIANTTGYLTNPTSGNSEFFNTSIVQVIAPIADIATAIDDNMRLQEIDNKTSWLVTDGTPGGTAGESTDGRLIGLRPKGENYDPNNDYTTRT